MSIRFRVEATSVHPALVSAEAFLEHVTPIASSAIRAFGMAPVVASHRDEDGAVLDVMCFRGFEPLSLRWEESGRMVAEARTAAMGPGYHQHLCDHVLPAIAGPLDLRWTTPHPEACFDETGYFFDKDRAALEACHLGWLSSVCERVGQLAAENHPDLQLAMPVTPRFVTNAFLVTPQGPRTTQWTDAVLEDAGNGRDFFTWWEPGETPANRLKMALWLMWNQIAWRRALDDDDTALNETVLRLLSEAHRDAPDLVYPFAAWAELAALAGATPPPGTPAADEPQIGYRRGLMWVDLVDGWRMCIPGGMHMEIDDEGNWTARDETRMIRFSSLNVAPGAEGRLLASREDIPETDRVSRDDDLSGEAHFEPDGLYGSVYADGCVGMLSVHFHEAEEREWALDVWHSLGVAK